MSMIINPYVFGSVASYYANASQLDGTNDELAKASAISAATSSGFTLGMWINPTSLTMPVAGVATPLYISGGAQSISVTISSDGTISVDSYNGAVGYIAANSAVGAISTGSWKWLGISLDTNFSAGNKLAHMYLNDTNILSASDDPAPAFSLDFSAMTEVTISPLFSGAVDRLNAGIAEYYLSTAYTDLSNVTNRRKFITAGGKPENLGTDGSLVSGSTPAVYLNNPFGSFQTNKGSGGDFTVIGALAAAATSPSD